MLVKVQDEIHTLKTWMEDRFVTKEECISSKSHCARGRSKFEVKIERTLIYLSIGVFIALGLRIYEFLRVFRIVP